jgi:predicted TPR repeat methyltransferase
MLDVSKKSVEVYDKIAHQYAAAFDSQLGDKIFLDAFIRQLKREDKVIDLGSGTGQHAKYLSDNGLDVEGIELSSEMLTIAKNNYKRI